MGIAPRWGVRIPMRDGIELSASLYLPPGQTDPAPALFAMTPYTVHRNHPRASFFAASGYPFLVVDVRGRGNSDGEFDPWQADAKDAADIVEWAAQQPFCNGKVGMFSGSYEGFVQWTTAKEFPPHLASIAPSASAAPGIEFPWRNNRASTYLIHWLNLIAGRTAQENLYNDHQMWRDEFRKWFESGRPYRELDEMVGMPSAFFQRWLDHPTDDAYWQATRPSPEQFARIDLPILTLTGQYDSQQQGALYYYREHRARATPGARARHYLLLGPWDHFGILAPRDEAHGVPVGEAGRTNTLDMLRQWYDWTLRDGPRPGFLTDDVVYYVTGSDRWRSAAELEDATTRTEDWFLASTANPDDVTRPGSLGAAPAGGPDSYVLDPRDTSLAELQSTLDAWSAVDDTLIRAATGRQVVYESRPFTEPTELAGFFRLSVWIGIDQPDADIGAEVWEITADGSSIRLGADAIRARYRDDPVHATLLTSGEPVRYEFRRFPFFARRLAAGSRLRLVIGALHSIFDEKNYQAGGVVADETVADARTATFTILHEETRPSALSVPFGHPD